LIISNTVGKDKFFPNQQHTFYTRTFVSPLSHTTPSPAQDFVMPVDHISYSVHFSKFDDEVNFILAAFKHLGYKEFMRPCPGVVGLGDDQPWLWISGLDNRQPIGDDVKVLTNHIALGAKGMFAPAFRPRLHFRNSK
jgi:hypothetical protein